MSSIIRSEENGIEFYTIAATGESGMSQSGLAILCGVARQTLQSMAKNLAKKAPSEILEPWVYKPFTLAERGTIKGKSVGKLSIYSADFCAAVIQHYAFAGNKTAQLSLAKFATIGINTWIQGITHWDSTPLDLQNIIATAQKFLGEYLNLQEAKLARRLRRSNQKSLILKNSFTNTMEKSIASFTQTLPTFRFAATPTSSSKSYPRRKPATSDVPPPKCLGN